MPNSVLIYQDTKVYWIMQQTFCQICEHMESWKMDMIYVGSTNHPKCVLPITKFFSCE